MSLRTVKSGLWHAISLLPYLRICYQTRATQTPVRIHHLLRRLLVPAYRRIHWPIHSSSLVTSPENILCGIETSPGYMPGCYIQGAAGIVIGDYTQIAANVAIVSSNHDVHDSRAHVPSAPIVIGKYCWIGANAVILPGVTLGDNTVVGAGAVVTRSFPEGYCVIAGNPARKLRSLEPEACVKHQSQFEYSGFLTAQEFRHAISRKLPAKLAPFRHLVSDV